MTPYWSSDDGALTLLPEYQSGRTGNAMGSHQQAAGGADEWLTPPELVAAVGPFALDPCAPSSRPWPTADAHYDIEQDGLRQPWTGLVWLNPPYSTARRWMARLAEHGNGVALLFARTETALWHQWVWPYTSGVLFLRGRLHFCRGDGIPARANAGAPSALIAYGDTARQRLVTASALGCVVNVDHSEETP